MRPPLLFLEDTTPPPFYQPQLSDKERTRLDALFIGKRSQAYYLKRFAQIDQAGKLIARWHWAAFFMTFGWLLYRKRYLDCLVYCVAGLSFVKLTIVISLSVLEFVWIGHLPAQMQWIVRAVVALGIWVFWAIQVARWSDAYYYRMARREIADALALYPNDQNAQAEYLQKHGGVSWVGFLAGFALFLGIIGIVVLQFVPIVATQKEQQLISDSYKTVYAAHHRVEQIIQSTGQCPTYLPLSVDAQKNTMHIQNTLEGTNSDCAIVLTVTGALFPVRYLNGQTLVMYRIQDDGKVLWRCQTSLNKKRTPKRCVG